MNEPAPFMFKIPTIFAVFAFDVFLVRWKATIGSLLALLVKFIEGDKKKKEKNKVIFPHDLLFKRSDATYMCSLSFYVRSKTTK